MQRARPRPDGPLARHPAFALEIRRRVSMRHCKGLNVAPRSSAWHFVVASSRIFKPQLFKPEDELP